MSVIFNGTTVDKANFNGKQITSMIWDGVQVFQRTPKFTGALKINASTPILIGNGNSLGVVQLDDEIVYASFHFDAANAPCIVGDTSGYTNGKIVLITYQDGLFSFVNQYQEPTSKIGFIINESTGIVTTYPNTGWHDTIYYNNGSEVLSPTIIAGPNYFYVEGYSSSKLYCE